MSDAHTLTIPAQPSLSIWRQALIWMGLSVVAVPIAVLLHELGHHLVHLLLGFKGAALHYSAATYSAEEMFWQLVNRGDFQGAATLTPLWRPLVSTAAGLFVTYAVILLCCYIARHKPHPLVIAVGLVSTIRFLSAITVISGWVSGRPVRSNTDEAHLSMLSGIPAFLPVMVGVILFVGAWFWLIRSIPSQRRATSIGSLLVGIAVGLVLYFRFVGPLVLP